MIHNDEIFLFCFVYGCRNIRFYCDSHNSNTAANNILSVTQVFEVHKQCDLLVGILCSYVCCLFFATVVVYLGFGFVMIDEIRVCVSNVTFAC